MDSAGHKFAAEIEVVTVHKFAAEIEVVTVHKFAAEIEVVTVQTFFFLRFADRASQYNLSN